MVRLSICRFGLEKIAQLLTDGTASRVVVLAGAGISTASGLPDFRSPGSGLYDNLIGKHGLPYPQAVFEIDYFNQNPKPFFQVAKSLYPGLYAPNATHWFVRLLSDKNLLERIYTQNIDCLEKLSGVPQKRIVEAHGSFENASCLSCGKAYAAEEIKETIFADEVPTCSTCKGVIKPDIVFFGEMMPQRFNMLGVKDMFTANLVIVMGTSLEVYPFAGLADRPAWKVPRLLINKDKVGSFLYDARPNDCVYEGDLVEGVRKLAKLCSWENELQTLEDDYSNNTKREE